MLENPTKHMYASSRGFKAFSQLRSGHVLNMAKNATVSFDVIFGVPGKEWPMIGYGCIVPSENNKKQTIKVSPLLFPKP